MKILHHHANGRFDWLISGHESVPWKRLNYESCHFSALAGISYKYNKCHTALEGLSSVCAKLEPASSKNNEILEINVLQKFTVYVLFVVLSESHSKVKKMAVYVS